LMFEEDLGQQYKYTWKQRSIKLIKTENSANKDIKAEKYADAAKKMYSLYELDKKTLLIYTCLHPIIWRLKIMMRLLWTTNYYAK
jgi:hypothetical protein